MKPRRKRLIEQVEGCRRALEAGGPAQSVWVESLGRALRLLGDPEATPYLRRAAEMNAHLGGYPGLLHLGNLYRLAGDEGASRERLERAYQILKSERKAIRCDNGTREYYYQQVTWHSYLQGVCLLSGRDAEAEAIGDWLASFTGWGLNTLPLIARSRRTRDPEPARRAMSLLARRIRDSELSPFKAGFPVTDWDWYELAIEAAGRSNKPTPEEVDERERLYTELVDGYLSRCSGNVTHPELFVSRLARLRLPVWLRVPFTNFRLRGRDLGGLDLRGADLRGADLSGSSLWEADLRGADLRGASLKDALARDATLREANLSEASLEGTNLSGADLEAANLKDANANGAVLTGANLDGADLDGTDLYLAALKGVRLRLAKNPQKACYGTTELSGADLRGVDLSSVRIENVDAPARMIGADLRGADLSGSIAFLDKCVLSEADLREVDFSGAFMGNPIMNDADLRGAIFGGTEETDMWSLKGANLEGVDLSGLDLRRSEFEGANLRAANLGGADLRGADFTEADLTGADLEGAILEATLE
jgi:uncharacterized protein YjbI with pentapeptide repeats